MTLYQALLLTALAAFATAAPAVAAVSEAPASADLTGYATATVADDLHWPWAVAFLPGGDLLVTERSGQLRRVTTATGAVSEPLAGVPAAYFAGQGGLLDVVLHPQFVDNHLVYLSYAHGDGVENATRIARGRLTERGLEDVQVLFTAAPTKDTPQHYGGAMAFLPDGTLLLTTGDGFDYREQAQSLASLMGKTIRITADGGVPPDNPFVDEPDAAPEVWTYGHRNPQGLVVHPVSGRVYLHEHGPRGGDELNVLQPGHNYGWPAITYGIDYSGAYVSPFTHLDGMEQPLMHWVPSIAPSGLALYLATAFPEWQGDLFVGALVDREVRRIDLEDGTVAGEQALFAGLGERIRDVAVGPDGHLYLVTDSEQGRILRVERAR